MWGEGGRGARGTAGQPAHVTSFFFGGVVAVAVLVVVLAAAAAAAAGDGDGVVFFWCKRTSIRQGSSEAFQLTAKTDRLCPQCVSSKGLPAYVGCAFSCVSSEGPIVDCQDTGCALSVCLLKALQLTAKTDRLCALNVSSEGLIADCRD